MKRATAPYVDYIKPNNHTMPKKYAIWDNSTQDYLDTGYGSRTLEALKNDLLEYLSGDHDANADWEELQDLPVNDIAQRFNMEIHTITYIK